MSLIRLVAMFASRLCTLDCHASSVYIIDCLWDSHGLARLSDETGIATGLPG